MTTSLPTHHAILGLGKLKRAEVVGRASHQLRGHLVANADPARAALNVTSWKGSAHELADEIEARVGPLRKRKDAVSSIELMLTASPGWFKEHGGTGATVDLLARARQWLGTTFGASNVVAFGVHRDESTPHIWALVTPITPDGRLSAAHWCDGPKKLAAMHDTWAAATADLGLTRGVRASRAQHVDVRTFYAAANGSPAATMKLTREVNARAGRAKARAELEETEWAAGAAKRSQVVQQLRAEQIRLEHLARAMDPDQVERAAVRLQAIEQGQKPPAAIVSTLGLPQPTGGQPEARRGLQGPR
jgi:hypothetical protein